MITFGILGTAQIVHRFYRGAKRWDGVQIRALASRDFLRAQSFVRELPGVVAMSYEELLQDPAIDAVYIATPNFTHEALIMRCLQAGKHVLCEKPLLLHETQVASCFGYAKAHHLLLMEAMKPAFLPTTRQAIDWIEKGAIGSVQYIQATYCHNNLQPFQNGWHQDVTQGGGVLYDIGVYPIGFVHSLLQEDAKITYVRQRTDQNTCDVFDLIYCRYGDIDVTYLCSCDTMMNNEAIICGSEGRITIKNFWKSDTAILTNAQGEQCFYEPHEQSEFVYEIRSFCEAITNGLVEHPWMNETQSRRIARVIDQIRKEGV